MLTLLHGSDIHFGKPHDAGAMEAFVRTIQSTAPDLLVVSGDLTQRAKVSEYQGVRAFLDQVAPLPTVVTPGNHDVPLYRAFERLFDPYRNYRRYISPDLDTVTRIPGATVVALNSAAPRRRIVNGRVRRSQLEFARAAFEEAEAADVKIVVIHHHIAPPPDYGVDYPLPDGRQIVAALTDMGVDLILSGHLHRSYSADVRDVASQIGRGDENRALVLHSGTTTSTRGRAREQGRNSCNLIRVHADRVDVTVLMLDREHGFVPYARHQFPRRTAGTLPGGG